MTMFCNLLWTTLIVGGAELVGRKLQIKCQIKLQIRLCHSQRWTQHQRERQRNVYKHILTSQNVFCTIDSGKT